MDYTWLKQKDMVVGLPLIDRNNLQVYEGCIYGKIHHLPSQRIRGGLKLLLNWCIWIYLVQLDILLYRIKGTFFYLLMMTPA